MTVPAALQACNDALGIEQNGPLLTQSDMLVEQLGLEFEATPQLEHEIIVGTAAADSPAQQQGARSSTPIDTTVASCADLSAHTVLSAPVMVHAFTSEVHAQHGGSDMPISCLSSS